MRRGTLTRKQAACFSLCLYFVINAFACAGSISIDLPELVGSYDGIMSQRQTYPVTIPDAYRTNVRQIELHIKGNHTGGICYGPDLHPSPRPELSYDIFAEIQLTDRWAILDSSNHILALVTCSAGNILEEYDGSFTFDVVTSFDIFYGYDTSLDETSRPTLNWNDYTSDGMLDLTLWMHVPLEIVEQAQLNITEATLVLHTIPEPATLALLALGAMLLKGRR